MITKRALSRRTMLKGLGATVALPMLDAMLPVGVSAQTGRKPIRLIAMEMVHGAAGSTANVFALPSMNHRVDVFGGVLMEESGRLLSEFFAARRKELT